MLPSRLRGDRQGSCSRHHHYPIPSARGEARGVCKWVAEYSSSMSTPMIRVACSADRMSDACLLNCTTATTAVFQGFSRVGSNLAGRVGSGRVGWPDPTRESFDTSSPDPTRPAAIRVTRDMRVSCGSGQLDPWHFSRVKVEESRVKACIPRSVGWSLVPRTFPRMSCSMVLSTGIVCSSILWCAREKW